jgi:hypothetical protein
MIRETTSRRTASRKKKELHLARDRVGREQFAVETPCWPRRQALVPRPKNADSWTQTGQHQGQLEAVFPHET